MAKSIIVISSLVDSTIRDGQVDVSFQLFKTLDELGTFIEKTPVRADYLYFTREAIPHTNTSLNFIASMLANPFLKVDKVCYITERDSSEIPSVQYIVEEKGYDNWEIIEGYLTREYVNGVINGSLRTESFNKKRKAVYRVPRAAYVKDRIRDKQTLDEDYVDDDKYLGDVPDLEPPEEIISEAQASCRIVHVAGEDNEERTVLSYLIAQYLAFTGKVLIVEKDTDYHLLSDYVAKSGVDCLQIDMSEFLEDPTRVIEKIRVSSKNLVCITVFERIEYSYSFITSVLYNNLANILAYMVVEDTFEEAPTTENYIVTIPATVIGALRACEKLDTNFLHLAKFVGVNLKSLPEMRIVNGKALATLLSDILEFQIPNTVILNVNSLKIGGEAGYDLRSVIGE